MIRSYIDASLEKKIALQKEKWSTIRENSKGKETESHEEQKKQKAAKVKNSLKFCYLFENNERISLIDRIFGSFD